MMSSQDFDTSDVSLVAQLTPSSVGQRAAYHLNNKGYLNSLQLNPNLDPELWKKFYRSGYPADAVTLLTHAPSINEASYLLTEVDKDIKLGAVAWGVPHLTDELITEFIKAQPDPSPFLPGLLQMQKLGCDLQARLWALLYKYSDGPRQDTLDYVDALTCVVTKYEILSDTEVVEVLERLYKMIHRRDGRYTLNLTQMIDYRPNLIPLLLASPYRSNFFAALAVSQHLRAQSSADLYEAVSSSASYLGKEEKAEILGSISRNPSVPYEVRASAIFWMNSAKLNAGTDSFSHSLNDLRIHYLGLAALGVKPVEVTWDKAPADKQSEIVKHIDHIGTSRFPTLEHAPRFSSPYTDVDEWNKHFIQKSLTPYLDSLGPSAWDLFLGLLEGWHSSMDALLEVITTTITK